MDEWHIVLYTWPQSYLSEISCSVRFGLWKRGFRWIDCSQEQKSIYVFEHTDGQQKIIAVFNFSDRKFSCKFEDNILEGAKLLLANDNDIYGGNCRYNGTKMIRRKEWECVIDVEPFSANYFLYYIWYLQRLCRFAWLSVERRQMKRKRGTKRKGWMNRKKGDEAEMAEFESGVTPIRVDHHDRTIRGDVYIPEESNFPLVIFSHCCHGYNPFFLRKNRAIGHVMQFMSQHQKNWITVWDLNISFRISRLHTVSLCIQPACNAELWVWSM